MTTRNRQDRDEITKEKKKNRSKKALVVTTRNTHYRIVRPVVEGLQRRYWKVTVLRFERIWERVESLLRRAIRRRSFESFYVNAPPIRQKRINWYVYNFIAKLVFVLMRLSKVEKPNIILVLTDSTPPSKIAVLVGRIAHVPSLLLHYVGMIGRYYACPSFLVDKIVVTGKFARDMLIRCGIDETKLVVTGRPTYDSLVRRKKYFEKEKICNKLGLDPKKKIVVFTTQPLLHRVDNSQVYAICKAMKEFSGLQFVIKVHPAELSLSNYERITKDIGVNALITRDADIYEVLYVCDVMITGFSATALDAMMLDKPVVTVNFTGLEDPLPFAESGAAIGVYEEKDIIAAIKMGLYDEDTREELRVAREKFVYEHSYKRDGKSTERVVKLIGQMVQKRVSFTSSSI